MKATCHISVMEREVVKYLMAEKGGDFLDCTFGGAGHTLALLKANSQNRVVAVDRDQRAIERGTSILESYRERVEIKHGRFSELLELVGDHKFDGVLADLGVSTDQLRENRGFSFKDQGALDMRMDEGQSYSAYNVVNESSERELFEILKRGGVGQEAWSVLKAIIAARPIESTVQLAQVINGAVHGKIKAKKINPATVTFQAIRVAVNDELGEIDQLMQTVPSLIKDQGRLAVITFHSLEDRAVTKIMRSWRGEGIPALLPGADRIAANNVTLGKMISNRAIVPSEEEVERNPQARSARLRVFKFN